MLFDQEAIRNRLQHLDLVLKTPELVEEVVGRHLVKPFNIVHLPRVWEPGGGATIFRIESSQGNYLLKVKHCEVWVGSRLEWEPSFTRKSGLVNEHEMLEVLRRIDFISAPKTLFFERVGELDFLATECLETFSRAVHQKTANELIAAWRELVQAVRRLYEEGIAHTDIHEHNLCFRENQIVLIDFEEARFLKQDVPFERSMDVSGANRYGKVGNFPMCNNGVPGLTSLDRLKRVFQDLVRQRLPSLLERCNFDHTCPYNLDSLQKPDPRVYQSLDFRDLRIVGHRPLADARLKLLALLFRKIASIVGPISHLDIGSNLGVFCFTLSKLRCVHRSAGVEASEDYVHAAESLAFVYDQEKTQFLRLICGKDVLAERFRDVTVATMFSVYHHIADKDRFLADLGDLGLKYLIAEFATEDRYYPERGCLQAEIRHIQERLGFAFSSTVGVSKDYDRPILVFSHSALDRVTIFISKWAASGGRKQISELVRRPLRRIRHITRSAAPALRPLFRALRRKTSGEGGALLSEYCAALKWIDLNSVPGEGIKIYAGGQDSYPEVTGYFIPSLLDWGELDRAVQFARWLMLIQSPDGSWPGPSRKSPYTFDTGQILKGLIAISSVLPEVEGSIRRGCDWLLTQVRPDGSITTPDKSYWGLPNGKMIDEKIHLYALGPLREAARRFNENRYLVAVDRALAFYLAQPGIVDFDTLSHFHAYVLEGLVDLGHAEAASRGMEKVEHLQAPDGSVPAYPDVKWVCSTGLAQYAVIWYKLGRREHAQKAFNYFRSLQNRSGGFYGGSGCGANYYPDKEISWAVKYFLDAYYWHVRTAFDADAGHFPAVVDQADGRFKAILKYLGDLSGRRVLDAGCGRGRFATGLFGRYPSAEMWGVDISDGMLRHVPSQVKTRQGSLLRLPFESSHFDAVFCVGALEHSVNPEAAVRELCRVVKPGGSVLIVDKNDRRRGMLKTESWERWFEEKDVTA